MAFELFSIIGRIAVEGMGNVNSQLNKVKTGATAVTGKLSGMSAIGAKLDQKFMGLNTRVQGFNTKIQNNSAALTGMGTKLTAVGVAVVALGGFMLKTGAEFDSGMRKVGAVSGATDEQLKQLTAQAKELGSTTQFSAKQAADAMGFLSMAGFDANEVLGAMPSTLQLAAAAQLDLGSAADITSNILSGFGLEVSELGRANDVLVKTFTSANTDLVQLGQAMKFVGPVAKAAGVGFEETAAAVGLLGNAGIQASMAGTTLRGAITRLLNPAGDAGTAMKRLGLNVKDADGQFIGFNGIVKQLENSVVRLQDPTAFTSDLMQIFGQRAGPGMAALIDQGSDALSLLTLELEASGGTAKRIADAQMAGLTGAFLEFKSAMEGVQIAIVESGVGDFFAMLLRKGADVLRWFTTINPQILKWGALIIGAFGAAATVIGPLLIILPSLTAGFAALTGWIAGAGGITAALTVLTGPVGWIIAGVVALIAVLISWRTEISEVVAGVVALVQQQTWLMDSLKFLKAVFSTVAGFVIDTVVAGFNMFIEVIKFLNKDLIALFDFLRAEGVAAMDASAEATERASFKAEVLGGALDKATDAQAALTREQKASRTSAESSAKQIGELGDQIRRMTELLDDATEEEAKVIRTKIKLANLRRDALLAAPLVEKAEIDITKATADGAEAIDKKKKKLIEFKFELEELIESRYTAWQDKLIIITDESAEVVKVTERSRQAVRDLGTASGPALRAVEDSIVSLAAKAAEVLAPIFEQRLPESIQKITDAFEDMGLKTRQEIEDLATTAEQNFETIRDSGLATPATIEEAWVKMTQSRKEALQQNGQDLAEEEQRMLDDILASQKGHTEDSVSIFESWKNQVSTIMTDFGKGVTKALFAFFDRAKHNDDLDAQTDDLRVSLAERVDEFIAFSDDIDSAIKQLADDHSDVLADMDADFEESLAVRLDKFEEFSSDSLVKFERFAEELHRKEEEKVAGIIAAIQKGQDKLKEFERDLQRDRSNDKRDTAQDLSDKDRKNKDSLKKKTRDLKQFEVDARKSFAKKREKLEIAAEKKIARIRERGADDASAQISRVRNDLADSLRFQERDLEDSISRRRREHQDWIDDTATDLARITEIEKRELEEREEEARLSLDRKRQDQEAHEAELLARIEKVREETSRKLTAEEEELTQSLDRRGEDFEEWKRLALVALEEKRQAHADGLASEEQALRDSLADQALELQAFTDDTNDKLAGIADNYRTVFGDLKSVFFDIFLGEDGMAGSLTRFVSEFLVGKLFGALNELKDKVLPAVFNKLASLFGFVGNSVSTSVGKIPGVSIPGLPGGGSTTTLPFPEVGGGIPGVPSGGIPGLGGASSILGAGNPINVVTGVVSAVSDVIGNFQMMAMNKTLDLIEHSTRFTQLFLGGRADQGVIGVLFRVLESIDFGHNTKANEEARDFIKTFLPMISGATKAMETELAFGFNTKANERSRDLLGDFLPRISSAITSITPSVTVNVPGMIVRDEADIDKIAAAIWDKAQLAGGATTNL